MELQSITFDQDTTTFPSFMQRLIHSRKARPMCMKLPMTSGVVDKLDVHAAVLAALSAGHIILEEASILAGLIDSQHDVQLIAQRINRLPLDL